MEKLIDLLNEYSWKEFWSLSWWAIECDEDRDSYKYLDTFIISKKYWFIKWLVVNNKIDWRKLRWKSSEISEACLRVYQWREYESLLMLLSISSSPLNDLIQLLK